VVDAEGNPVEGAAVKIDKNVLLTNSSGEFFLRTKRAGSYRLEIALEEFANAARFELVSAPAEVHSAREENASTVSIVLKLKGTASHPDEQPWGKTDATRSTETESSAENGGR
jgi:hypothetical protein